MKAKVIDEVEIYDGKYLTIDSEYSKATICMRPFTEDLKMDKDEVIDHVTEGWMEAINTEGYKLATKKKITEEATWEVVYCPDEKKEVYDLEELGSRRYLITFPVEKIEKKRKVNK
jgi:hypothetical protein